MEEQRLQSGEKVPISATVVPLISVITQPATRTDDSSALSSGTAVDIAEATATQVRRTIPTANEPPLLRTPPGGTPPPSVSSTSVDVLQNQPDSGSSPTWNVDAINDTGNAPHPLKHAASIIPAQRRKLKRADTNAKASSSFSLPPEATSDAEGYMYTAMSETHVTRLERFDDSRFVSVILFL